MLTTPFFTDLDPRAAVKGSRDPLGTQQIWTRLGRQVVGNLTTVSNSLRDFTTLVLGYYFAGLLADDLGPGSELATFLRWEQLAAYARAEINEDYSFRGTERVRKNLSQGSRVTLSADRAHQILGNQKMYGLWGLYTMPARASGLIDGDPPRLTPLAVEFVERTYLPALQKGAGRGAQRILEVLRRTSYRVDVRGADKPMVASVARVLRRRVLARERGFYRTSLLHGGPDDSTEGRQRQLAELLELTLGRAGFTWSPQEVADLEKETRARGEDWHPLAHRLERILTSERVLAPASAVFAYLLGLDGKSVAAVAGRLGEAWGSGLRTVHPEAFAQLRGEVGPGDDGAGDRWFGIAYALSTGDYSSLVRLLVEQNASVMAARGGAPWVEVRQDALHVHVRDERGALPDRSEVATMWRCPYFLDALRSIAAALQGA